MTRATTTATLDDAVTVDLEAIAANLSHTERAQQLASKLAGPARVRALVAVGDQADENLFEYADDVAWVSGDLQPSFVAALRRERRAALERRSTKLLKRAERLAKPSRAKMLASVTDALADGDPELLLELLAEEADVTPASKADLVGSLQAIIDDTDGVVAGLARALDEGRRRPSAARCAPR